MASFSALPAAGPGLFDCLISFVDWTAFLHLRVAALALATCPAILKHKSVYSALMLRGHYLGVLIDDIQQLYPAFLWPVPGFVRNGVLADFTILAVTAGRVFHPLPVEAVDLDEAHYHEPEEFVRMLMEHMPEYAVGWRRMLYVDFLLFITAPDLELDIEFYSVDWISQHVQWENTYTLYLRTSAWSARLVFGEPFVDPIGWIG